MDSDDELFQTMRRELFTAVVGDVLDAAGLTRQFLPAGIKPLDEQAVAVGRAMPVLEADCAGPQIAHRGEMRPFGLMLEALDDLRPGEVYCCTGASQTYAVWGGLMTTRATHLGAAGAILDGYSRDSRELARFDFPIFSTGRYAQDQAVRGRVIDYRCQLRYRNGVLLRPGDIVFGDIDGVVVVPREHEKSIINDALQKVRGENLVRKALESGITAGEAFRRYGIM